MLWGNWQRGENSDHRRGITPYNLGECKGEQGGLRWRKQGWWRVYTVPLPRAYMYKSPITLPSSPDSRFGNSVTGHWNRRRADSEGPVVQSRDSYYLSERQQSLFDHVYACTSSSTVVKAPKDSISLEVRLYPGLVLRRHSSLSMPVRQSHTPIHAVPVRMPIHMAIGDPLCNRVQSSSHTPVPSSPDCFPSPDPSQASLFHPHLTIDQNPSDPLGDRPRIIVR